MDKDLIVTTKKIIDMDDTAVRGHLRELVRDSVEEMLNGLLDAEADHLCGAKHYERSPDRVDSRAGSYPRGLETQAGKFELKRPKLRTISNDTGEGRARLKRPWLKCTWRACRFAGWKISRRGFGVRV